MNPLEPRPAIVHQVQDQGRENCIGLYKLAVKHDTQALDTAIALGRALMAYKKRVLPGQWLAELKDMGIPSQRASECLKLALFETVKPEKVKELGTKTAVLRYLSENPQGDRYDEECGVEEETPGTGNSPGTGKKTGGGPATGSTRAKPGKAGSPPSKQQTFEMDQQEAKERLEKEMRRFLRVIFAEVQDINERLQYKLRLETQAAEELRRISRLSLGPLGEFTKVPAPEVAAGFEEKQEPDRYEWRVLTAMLNVLAQVGGKEE